jgi:hypothetical protein
VRDWIAKRERIESEYDTQRKKFPWGGRKLTSNELDELLFEAILDKRTNGIRVTRSDIKRWGAMLAEEMGVQLEFSEGWLSKFMERHVLTLRRISANWSVPRDMMASRAASFYIYC